MAGPEPQITRKIGQHGWAVYTQNRQCLTTWVRRVVDIQELLSTNCCKLLMGVRETPEGVPQLGQQLQSCMGLLRNV